MTLGTKGFGLDIGKLFEPRSIAVIGASERKGSPGEAVLRNLLRARFKGRVYPINPKYEKLGRRRCYPDVRSIGKEIDLAVLVTPARAVPGVLEECGESGIDAAIVISAGFRETGEEGRALERSVVRGRPAAACLVPIAIEHAQRRLLNLPVDISDPAGQGLRTLRLCPLGAPLSEVESMPCGSRISNKIKFL